MTIEEDNYKGFRLVSCRVGIHGEYRGEAHDARGQVIFKTRRYSGTGAARAAFAEIRRIVDHYGHPS